MEDVIGYIKLVRVFDYLLCTRGAYSSDAIRVVSEARRLLHERIRLRHSANAPRRLLRTRSASRPLKSPLLSHVDKS